MWITKKIIYKHKKLILGLILNYFKFAKDTKQKHHTLCDVFVFSFPAVLAGGAKLQKLHVLM